MTKHTLKILILYSFYGLILGGILFLITPIRDIGYTISMIFLGFGQLSGIFLYFLESKINKTIYFKFIIAGFLINVIGAIFKIQHWPKSLIIISIGFSVILITYSIRFINKKDKGFLDYVKVIWLALAIIGSYFKICHWPYSQLILDFSYGTFWIGLLYVLYDFKFKTMIKKD